MRILFSDVARPKAAAKLISRVASDVRLAAAQEAVARACGYRDWHELAGAPFGATLPTYDAAVAATVISAIAEALGLPFGDVQFAVAKSRMLAATPWRQSEQLSLIASIWRTRVFGSPAPLKPGSVVEVIAHGERRPAYLRKAGRPTYVLYDRADGICADFEAKVPRQPLADFAPSRLWLPYGYWVLGDGSEVAFARDYLPLWRVAGARVERLDPWLWIEGISETHVFSSILGTTIWNRGPAREAALGWLGKYRISGLPRLIDVVPALISDATLSIHRGVDQLRHRVGVGKPLAAYARLRPDLAYM